MYEKRGGELYLTAPLGKAMRASLRPSADRKSVV